MPEKNATYTGRLIRPDDESPFIQTHHSSGWRELYAARFAAFGLLTEVTGEIDPPLTDPETGEYILRLFYSPAARMAVCTVVANYEVSYSTALRKATGYNPRERFIIVNAVWTDTDPNDAIRRAVLQVEAPMRRGVAADESY